MTQPCCNSAYNLGCLNACGPIILPILAEATGLYTMRYTVGSATWQLAQAQTIGEPLRFDWKFPPDHRIGFLLYDPAGALVNVTDANGLTYDCFRFLAQYVRVVAQTSAPICPEPCVNEGWLHATVNITAFTDPGDVGDGIFTLRYVYSQECYSDNYDDGVIAFSDALGGPGATPASVAAQIATYINQFFTYTRAVATGDVLDIWAPLASAEANMLVDACVCQEGNAGLTLELQAPSGGTFAATLASECCGTPPPFPCQLEASASIECLNPCFYPPGVAMLRIPVLAYNNPGGEAITLNWYLENIANNCYLDIAGTIDPLGADWTAEQFATALASNIAAGYVPGAFVDVDGLTVLVPISLAGFNTQCACDESAYNFSLQSIPPGVTLEYDYNVVCCTQCSIPPAWAAVTIAIVGLNNPDNEAYSIQVNLNDGVDCNTAPLSGVVAPGAAVSLNDTAAVWSQFAQVPNTSQWNGNNSFTLFVDRFNAPCACDIANYGIQILGPVNPGFRIQASIILVECCPNNINPADVYAETATIALTAGPDLPAGVYSWTQVSGPALIITDPEAQNTTATGAYPGLYGFEVSVEREGCLPVSQIAYSFVGNLCFGCWRVIAIEWAAIDETFVGELNIDLEIPCGEGPLAVPIQLFPNAWSPQDYCEAFGLAFGAVTGNPYFSCIDGPTRQLRMFLPCEDFCQCAGVQPQSIGVALSSPTPGFDPDAFEIIADTYCHLFD